MDDKQYWVEQLEAFLACVEETADTPEPANVVADLRSGVRRWIRFALEYPAPPGERNEPLLKEWVTNALALGTKAQSSYKSRVRRWWNWVEDQSRSAMPEAAGQDPATRLARLVAEFRAVGLDSAIAAADRVGTERGNVGGYSLDDQGAHFRARERFEEILRRLPTMPHAERQQLKEIWRPKGEGSYGGVGQIVQLASFIDRASESEWETLRRQLVDLCFGQGDLAVRLQSAVDEVHGLGWASATRVVAVLDPQRVIPNYTLHNPGSWAGKLDSLQMLMDEGLLEPDVRHRAETVLHEHPRSKPSGRAVVESNDLLLEILRPHFTEDDWVDTWGMRTFLYWLSERHMEHDAPHGAPGSEDESELDLSALVERFRANRPYPGEDDPQHLRAREQHERTLRSLNEIPWEDRQDIKSLWSTTNQNYGWCGQQPSLDRAVNLAAEESWKRLRNNLTELCFGDGELEDRIDTARGAVDGLGFLVATKLPAVCHPEALVPLYNLRRVSKEGQAPGKLDMIELLIDLGLFDTEQASEAEAIIRLHEERGDCGAVVVRSNDLLQEAIGPHFSDDGVVDTWGIARFLYWLAWEHRPHEPAGPWIDEGDLAALAKELLCDKRFLKDIVALLEDKGQVILYGPPGTGKTHFAHELAWVLTEYGYGEAHPGYSLVQFHPAYSYEDFFEGFRPHADDDGNMAYKLMPGPLVRLAERAADHSDELHVMVIDEINRANLPRVLGELLYLLEYRGNQVQTQYRPEDGFELPPNLWFIGTMNTADRSIALIDAAMRRRFHFVKFSPNEEPTKSLLRQWLGRHAPNAMWAADLLDGVNAQLAKELRDNHLLIGPSHFMTKSPDRDLTEDGVRRIWTYNIEPLIEDQFFGRQEVIRRFRFDEVWKDHGPGAPAPDSDSGTADGSGESAEPSSVHDENTESNGDD